MLTPWLYHHIVLIPLPLLPDKCICYNSSNRTNQPRSSVSSYRLSSVSHSLDAGEHRTAFLLEIVNKSGSGLPEINKERRKCGRHILEFGFRASLVTEFNLNGFHRRHRKWLIKHREQYNDYLCKLLFVKANSKSKFHFHSPLW
jgi:hypothetical protein